MGSGGKRTDIVTAMLRGRFAMIAMIHRRANLAVMHCAHGMVVMHRLRGAGLLHRCAVGTDGQAVRGWHPANGHQGAHHQGDKRHTPRDAKNPLHV